MFEKIKKFFEEIFTPQPELIPIPIKPQPSTVPTPIKPNRKLAWDGEHADYQEWDEVVRELVSSSQLPDLMPQDVISLCPMYSSSRLERVEFWCELISIIARYESGFDPSCYYEEDFLDVHGKPVVSRGLLQISLESANGYGAKLSDAIELHDVRTNIKCGVLILEKWVSKDEVMAGGSINAWRGGARYWSCLRDTNKSKPKIIAYLKAVYSSPIPKVQIEVVRESLVNNMTKNLGQRETSGKNRSPVIDAINKRAGASLGDRYCTSAQWCAVDDTCISLNLKNPVRKTASSQTMWTNTSGKYQKQEFGKKGDGAIFRDRSDPTHGHAAILTENQVNLKTFSTIEANTNIAGSRDGDGWYKKTRSVEGDKDKTFRGFIDFAQWIVDANG